MEVPASAREAPISETAAGAELPAGEDESIAFKASQVAETFTAGKKGKKGKTDG